MNVTEVKQGDPIVYEINGKAYNGVAVSVPALGHHPGFKTTSYHLNLNYLNENGQMVKIFGAPLLTKATGETEMNAIATHDANVFPEIVDGKRVVDVEAKKKQYHETVNRTIGWRPSEEGETIKALKESLAGSQASVVTLKTELSTALSNLANEQANTAAALQDLTGLREHADALKAHIDELSKPVQTEIEALKSQIAELTAESVEKNKALADAEQEVATLKAQLAKPAEPSADSGAQS